MSEIRCQKSEVGSQKFLFSVLCPLFSVFCLLSFYGCQGEGGVRDIALLRQAQKELRAIRNALEEYKIDHNTYPPEGSDLSIVLAPYISKILYSEGKDIPIHTKSVMRAKINLKQITNALSGCDRIKDAQVKTSCDHIRELLNAYEIVLNGKEVKIVPLRDEISNLRNLIDGLDSIDQIIDICEELDKALKVVPIVEQTMKETGKSAVIVQAQSSLHRMADAIRDYRRGKGKFPEPDASIDSVLHPYFIETTMSGEQIDRWQDALSWFASTPVYRTQDPDVEFELEATVNNEAKTHIISKMRVLNQWSEIVRTFADNSVVYTTPDSTSTYFLKSRARDSGLTWVTERPHKG